MAAPSLTRLTGSLTHLTLVRFFSRVDEVMLLEMGELGKALFTEVALEWPLPAMHS